MKKLVYCSQMEAIDKETQKTMLSLLLIEQAALRLWFRCKEGFPELSKESRLVFLCGGGNNGSDALAAARSAASEGYHTVTCVVLPRGNETHQMEQFFISAFPV
ncbi:MAG: NAD(P)H-hydrate epimerase, partial [Sphaerochaetaceae bacterium]